MFVCRSVVATVAVSMHRALKPRWFHDGFEAFRALGQIRV
jgi:hypothetical protein